MRIVIDFQLKHKKIRSNKFFKISYITSFQASPVTTKNTVNILHNNESNLHRGAGSNDCKLPPNNSIPNKPNL